MSQRNMQYCMTWCISTLTTMSQWATKKNSRSFRRHAHLSQRTSRRAVREVVHLKVVYRSGKGRQMISLTPACPSSVGQVSLCRDLTPRFWICAVSPLGSLGSCCMAFISSKAGVIWPEGHGTMEAWECNFTSPVLGEFSEAVVWSRRQPLL